MVGCDSYISSVVADQMMFFSNKAFLKMLLAFGKEAAPPSLRVTEVPAQTFCI